MLRFNQKSPLMSHGRARRLIFLTERFAGRYSSNQAAQQPRHETTCSAWYGAGMRLQIRSVLGCRSERTHYPDYNSRIDSNWNQVVNCCESREPKDRRGSQAPDFIPVRSCFARLQFRWSRVYLFRISHLPCEQVHIYSSKTAHPPSQGHSASYPPSQGR
jgi:hypothetical protein